MGLHVGLVGPCHVMSDGNPDRARRQTTLAAAAWKEMAPAALPAATPSAAPAAAQLVRTPAPTAALTAAPAPALAVANATLAPVRVYTWLVPVTLYLGGRACVQIRWDTYKKKKYTARPVDSRYAPFVYKDKANI